ncbi:MAG TPA: BLUF domain-containing protein [Halothiobacillus sp.]|nr:BLUF domain-containing protein [Halothiobacillus sp.]
MLVRLLYVSKVTPQVGHGDIRTILEASQRNNTPRGVSGLLMFNPAIFYNGLKVNGGLSVNALPGFSRTTDMRML